MKDVTDNDKKEISVEEEKVVDLKENKANEDLKQEIAELRKQLAETIKVFKEKDQKKEKDPKPFNEPDPILKAEPKVNPQDKTLEDEIAEAVEAAIEVFKKKYKK